MPAHWAINHAQLLLEARMTDMMWRRKLIENLDVFPESSLTDDEADDSGVSEGEDFIGF